MKQPREDFCSDKNGCLLSCKIPKKYLLIITSYVHCTKIFTEVMLLVRHDLYDVSCTFAFISTEKCIFHRKVAQRILNSYQLNEEFTKSLCRQSLLGTNKRNLALK